MKLKQIKTKLQDSTVIANTLSNSICVETLVDYIYRALAEEYQAWYQYHIVIPFMRGNERTAIADFFKKTADDELNDHAEKLLNRLAQLSDTMCKLACPDDWSKVAVAKYQYPACYDVDSLVLQNIKSEIEAVELYTELCNFTKGKDSVTNRLAKQILTDEQEHLQDLLDFAADLNIDCSILNIPQL